MPHILNLCGELASELASYFDERGISVLSGNDSGEISHILVSDENEIAAIAEKYQTVSKDIRLISLSQIRDHEKFIAANGRLILEEEWMKGVLGSFILDKFFQEYSGISLKDNYPAFQELGSFNVVNPFSTGDYLDRLVFEAFKAGVPALSLKTYFDHFLMFSTYLKAQGKIGYPLEVSYGVFDGIFGLQVHFFAEGLNEQDIQEALSTEVDLNSEKSALGIAVRSAGFLDLTFMTEVQKLVVTGLWAKDASSGRNSGFFMSSLTQASELNHFPIEELSPFFTNEEVMDDLSAALPLPGEERPIVISGSAPEKEAVSVVKGTATEKEASQVVKGSGGEEKEVSQTVKGSKAIAEKNSVVKGSKAEAQQIAIIHGTGPKERIQNSFVKGNKVVQNVQASLIQGSGGKEKPQLQRIGGSGPTKQEESLRLKGMGAGSSGQEQVRTFHSAGDSTVIQNYKKENDLLKIKLLNLGNELMALRESQNKIQGINSSSLKALEDQVVAEGGDADTLRKIQLESEKREAFYQQELQKLQRQNVNKETVLARLKESMSEVLKKKDLLIGDLQSKVNYLTLNKNEVHQRMENFEFNDFGGPKKISEESAPFENGRESDLLKARVASMAQEMQELRAQLGRAQSLASANKPQDIALAHTVDKLTRDVATKDLLLEKNREAFNRSLEKKDEEIRILQERNNQLIQERAATSQVQQVIHLERQVQNLSKMNESYKTRLSALTAEIEQSRSSTSSEDPKRLQMLLNQNKNIVEALKRDISKYQERASSDNSTIMNLKNEKGKLEQELRRIMLNTKVEKANMNLEQDLKKMSHQNQMLENQLKEALSKLKDMEGKLLENQKMSRNQSAPEDGQTKGKLAHLETSVKKLTQDLIAERNQISEAKKEINRARLEKTALQNQVDKLNKELERLKAAQPKKNGKAA